MGPNVRYVRALRNGQITIPADFRQAIGLDEAAVVQVTLDTGELRIRPYQPDKLESGADWLRDLYVLYSPVRKSAARLAGQEINRIIDLAIARVQRKAASCTE